MKQVVGELWMTGHAVSPETHQYIVMEDEWILAPTNRGQQGDFIAVIRHQSLFCFEYYLTHSQAETLLFTMQNRKIH